MASFLYTFCNSLDGNLVALFDPAALDVHDAMAGNEPIQFIRRIVPVGRGKGARNRCGTKTRAARPQSLQTRENGTRNAKSREHSLSAFCVNWLTGSFRAKNLSSLSGPLFESDQETRTFDSVQE